MRSGKRTCHGGYTSRFLLLAVAACGAPGAGKTAYTGAHVLDHGGGWFIPNAVIVVSAGRIERVGPADSVRVPGGAEVVRLDGKWVIPGLVDGHVHAERWALSRYLAYGVTSVRDVGGNTDSLVALRAQIASGAVMGPRLFISGAMIDGNPAVWSDATELKTPADAGPAVARLTDAHVSQIKLYVHTTRPLMEAVVSEARARGIPVTAHLGRVDALSAARAGVVAIEHLSGVVEATVRDPKPYFVAHERFFDGWKAFLRGWGTLDSASLDQTAAALIEHRVAMIPTLVQSETYARLNDPHYPSRLDLTGVPADVLAGWNIPDLLRRGAFAATDFAAFLRSRPKQDLFVRRYQARGGIVVAGSDSPNQLLAPGASLHEELGLLVRAGLSTADALRAATSDAAWLLGVGSIGVVGEGAVADFVVLSADPLGDIHNAARVEQVVSAGRRYTREELRRGW